ncbi:hypothetical protein ACFM0N_004061 [Vibrio parahaemolyticus]|uniref:hypothetical protein n=1 Tax=Vibrio parahaemolyticus TaxID=670 RepID=UPI0012AC6764|nr:hypothetical protein [Vibrio parahaemolyticus]EHH1074810.1 hypothetical protein [Vibrio parahaemolyticus]
MTEQNEMVALDGYKLHSKVKRFFIYVFVAMAALNFIQLITNFYLPEKLLILANGFALICAVLSVIDKAHLWEKTSSDGEGQ